MGFFKRANSDHSKRSKRGINKKFTQKKGKFIDRNDNKKKIDDEEIPSSDEDVDTHEEEQGESFQEASGTTNIVHDDDQHEEYEDNRSLAFREAKRMLESVKVNGSAGDDTFELENDAIDVPELEGKTDKSSAAKAHRKIADRISFEQSNADQLITYKPHRFTPVCLCFSSDSKFVVSCAKDGSVVKYDLTKGCRVGALNRPGKKKSAKNPKSQTVPNNHHKGQVLCCIVSPDDKYLVTGGADRLIKIWDLNSLAFIRNFDGHRGPVTSLRFRQQIEALEMFSASTDRSIMVWNMDELGLMNTLYGHQDGIEQIDILQWPRLISCGGMDKSCRLFKILEESHLVFNGFAECVSIDCVALINEEHFISGCVDGSLYLWSTTRKKPICVLRQAHGYHCTSQCQSTTQLTQQQKDTLQAESQSNRQANGEARWITAVAAMPYTDLVASGSSDGFLRLWRVSQDWKSLSPVDCFPISGFINDIRFSPDGRWIGCAVGQEHKRGRWWTLKGAQGAQNRIVVIPLIERGKEASDGVLRSEQEKVIKDNNPEQEQMLEEDSRI